MKKIVEVFACVVLVVMFCFFDITDGTERYQQDDGERLAIAGDCTSEDADVQDWCKEFLPLYRGARGEENEKDLALLGIYSARRESELLPESAWDTAGP